MKDYVSFKYLLIVIFLLLGNGYAYSQHELAGIIVDSQTKKAVDGVAIYIGKTTSGISDSIGMFRVFFKKRGVYTIRFAHLSYKSTAVSVGIVGDTTVTFLLTPKLHSLAEVTVSGLASERRGASFSISAIDMQKGVALLGERNIGLMLQQKPGVAHAQEINPGLYVRGFSNSQNKVLLNGSQIFNSNHLLGIYPSVNGSMVAKTEMLSDDVHPRYGDFLSACLVMAGNYLLADSTETEAGIGLLTSHIYRRAPIVKGKVSYVVAARRSYFDIISRSYNQLHHSDNRGSKLPDYSLYDLNGLVIIEPTATDKIVVSAFRSGDKLSQQQSYLHINADWGNTAANIRWDKTISKAISIRTSGGYSRYSTNTSVIKSDVSHIANSINRYNLSVDGMIRVGALAQVDVGLFGASTRTTIGNDSKEVNGDESVLSSKAGCYQSVGGYVAINQRVGHFLQVKGGLRMESYAGSKLFVSPRVYVQSPITRSVTIFASYSQRQQFDHLYAPMGVNLPVDMIIPSDDTLKPQQSRQVGFGATVRIGSRMQVLLSGYYSTLTNQVDFVNPEPLNQGFYYALGRGTARGLELMVSYKTDRFGLEASYSLSETRRQFAQINEGCWFNPPFDIRHKADFMGYLKLTSKLSLSVSQFVQSGNLVTVPSSIYFNQAKNQVVPVYTSRYNLRLPLAHRLDMSVQYSVVKSFGELRYSFGIYNVYNQANPYFIYFKPEVQNDERTRFVTKQKSLLPMVPFFMIELKL